MNLPTLVLLITCAAVKIAYDIFQAISSSL
jgi:hypothetical protein